jgi:hydrogenase maturation protease
MKTLILGLGNSILSDDSAGLRVVVELKDRLCQPDVTIQETELGGLNLLELLIGYDRAILVDAIQTGQWPAGTVYQFTPESKMGSLRINSTHSLNFADSLELGKKLGMSLPKEIVILAIEAWDVNTFSEQCTPSVRRAISDCADRVVRMVGPDAN